MKSQELDVKCMNVRMVDKCHSKSVLIFYSFFNCEYLEVKRVALLNLKMQITLDRSWSPRESAALDLW